jgi:3'(2'), 5'-bisphosphate nucleotidase
MIDYEQALSVGLDAVREASALVMQVYATGFAVDFKAKDDPVTEADRRSNDLLCERLSRAFPGVPLVAEESDPASYANFAGAKAAWFVDPLDGTREFVARNGEFAVMLGLAVEGRAVLGIIEAPAWGRAFAGIVGQGAWEVQRDGTRRPIHTSRRPSLRGGSVLVSRSRKHAKLPALVHALGAAECVAHGSSGLKAVLVATGDHDAYLQPGGAGMRWDACASEALVRAAGGECTQDDGTSFEYASGELVNAQGLIATNGLAHASVIETLRGL